MSKRTIILAVVAIVLAVAAFISLWLDYRSIVAEAKTIIDNDNFIEPENNGQPKETVKGSKKTKKENLTITDNGNPENETDSNSKE